VADQWLSTGTHVQVCWFPSSIKLTTAEINPHNSNPLNNLKFVRWCCSIQVFILYMVIIFIRPSLRQDVLWYTNVRLSVRPFHMSRSNLRTPWPIHFKYHKVIGIDGFTVCILYGEISNFHSRVVGLYSSNCRRFFVCRTVN
jgi:hypothetical protein